MWRYEYVTMWCRVIISRCFEGMSCLHPQGQASSKRKVAYILYITKLIWHREWFFNLTFIGPCIANIFAKYNQQDAKFHNLFISVRRSTCCRRVFRPSSGAQNCTYSVRYWSDRYCYLLLAARLAAGSSNGLTNTWRCMCSFELLMMDGKTVWNM